LNGPILEQNILNVKIGATTRPGQNIIALGALDYFIVHKKAETRVSPRQYYLCRDKQRRVPQTMCESGILFPTSDLASAAEPDPTTSTAQQFNT
jgi:hypothetical protein